MSRKVAPWNLTRRWLTATFVCWLLSPAARVQAHTTFPGLGEYTSGFLHPLTTVPHLLVLLAIGLWLGQTRPLRIKEPAALVALAAAVGLLLTVPWHVGAMPQALPIALALLIGAGVAAEAPVPSWLKTGVCGLAVLFLGLDSGVEASFPPSSVAKILAATWASLVLCVVNAAFYVSLLPPIRPAQIGIRVAGSWIVAIAFLLLAFSLRR